MQEEMLNTQGLHPIDKEVTIVYEGEIEQLQQEFSKVI